MNKKTKNSLLALIVCAAGLALGLMAKHIEIGNLPERIGEIASNLAILIFLGTIIAYYSKTSKTAALRVFLFFAGMFISYYIYDSIALGHVQVQPMVKWGILTACSALVGYIVWYSRRKGWPGALCAALPIGFLVWEGYSFYRTLGINDAIALILAVALYILLPRQRYQRFKVLPLVILVVLVITQFDVITGFLGKL